MMLSRWLFPLFVLCTVTIVSDAVITIKENGYRGITVAIHSNVPNDPRLVQSIKNLFLSGSSFLYQATKHRAYFNEVTIVVPNEWEYSPDYEIVRPNSMFANADVRIDVPNPEYGDAPYTQQVGECGDSGEYIHLTPDFLRGLEQSGTSAYGDPGRALVHEWAHLRYGVFDEHGYQHDSRTPTFYMDDSGQIKHTSCQSDVPGWLRDEGGHPCSRGEDGLPGNDCLFFPDMDHATAKASIMSMPYLPTMEGFCDNSDERKHNSRAPNMHNLMCQGRSTWEVLMDHQDFIRDRNSPRDDIDPVTLFRVVQPKKHDNATFVLVLDRSVSMRGKRMELLHRAAARFIRFQLRDYSSLGMVAFSTDVEVLANITTLDRISRPQLVDQVPREDEVGYTAIGRGLVEGLQLLTRSREPTEGALLLLVTDGEENIGPSIHDVLPKILAARVVINTIAFGQEASNKLEGLVKATGGRGFFFDDQKVGHKALDAAFLESATTQSDVELQPVEVISKYWPLDPGASQSGNFTLEKEIGTNTVFLATFDFQNISAALVSPTGKKYDNKAKEYTLDLKTNTISIEIPYAEPGLWMYYITDEQRMQPQDVSVIVTSEPRNIREQPIRVRAWVAEVDLTYPAQAKVYAEVKKDYNAIIGASVIATIDGPIGEPHVMMLYDNGGGADTVADDGVYSGYFTRFNGSGRYSVEALVVNNGKARIKLGSKGSALPHLYKLSPEAMAEESSKISFSSADMSGSKTQRPQSAFLHDVGSFERNVNAGSFRLQNWTVQDLIPPNRVTDLKVISGIEKDTIVKLSWTSPGDDMDEGSASSIDLRYHNDPNVLMHAFGEGIRITETDILAGTLDKLKGGTIETITVNISIESLDDPSLVVFFALVAYDDAGNRGHVSNVASAHWPVVDEKNVRRHPVDDDKHTLFSILIAVGGTIAFLVVLFAVALGVRSRRRKRKYQCKHEHALLQTRT